MTMTALSDYFKTTAERVKFDDLKEQALRNAYVSGTGVLYTYWDDKIRTGLYADESGTTPIQGDIACEVLDIENVYFGDPNLYDVQAQPISLSPSARALRICSARPAGMAVQRLKSTRLSRTEIPGIWLATEPRMSRRTAGRPRR